MAGALIAAALALAPLAGQGELMRATGLAILVVMGLLTYAILAQITGLTRLADLRALMRGRGPAHDGLATGCCRRAGWWTWHRSPMTSPAVRSRRISTGSSSVPPFVACRTRPRSTLSDNDYVRTRLTHSLEVASVGRSLGAGIGQVIAGRRRLPAELGAAEFGHIVSAACLAHDIGNPPFGHRGEELIQRWFRDAPRGKAMLHGLTRAQQQDLLQFEGNAQGFRILTRLQNWRDRGGLRLTAATLATFSKYPRLVGGAPARDRHDAGAQKFGVMQAEADIFSDVARETGLQPDGDGRWLRHPLAFLVEAADDICYTIIDLEDGFKLGKIPFDEAEALLLAVGGVRRRYQEIGEPARRIAYLRAKAIGELIGQVVEAFLQVEPQMLDGRYRAPLLAQVPGSAALAHITDVTARKVFVSDGDYERDLGADRVIQAPDGPHGNGDGSGSDSL